MVGRGGRRASSLRGEGRCLEANLVKHYTNVAFHIARYHANEPNPLASEVLLPLRVPLAPLIRIVDGPIDLDGETKLGAVEIYDEGIDCVLSPELQTNETTIPEHIPKQLI